MGVLLGLAVLFVTCGLISAVAAVVVSRGERRLAREGLTTTGTVVATEYDDHSGYVAKVELSTPAGRRTFFARMQRDGYKVGETVPVRYLSDRPDSVALDNRSGVYQKTILSISLSVGFAFGAAVMFVLNAHLASR